MTEQFGNMRPQRFLYEKRLAGDTQRKSVELLWKKVKQPDHFLRWEGGRNYTTGERDLNTHGGTEKEVERRVTRQNCSREKDDTRGPVVTRLRRKMLKRLGEKNSEAARF